jgi:hypothetical protein
MEAIDRAMPGHFPLRANRSAVLQPRLCGELKIGAGEARAGSEVLRAGDRVRLRAGERLEMQNVSAAQALYAWDPCQEQPSLGERARAALVRLAQAVGDARPARLLACGGNTWCVSR